MQKPQIEVRYSCVACGVQRATVAVPARGEEDVVVWVKDVMAPAIGEDHAARSPFCSSRTMSEVLIPITGAEKVGGPVVN